jgi:hypothetical protein
MIRWMKQRPRAVALLMVLAAACGITGPDDERLILYVGPERVECIGVVPRMCLLVKETPEAEWSLFYDEIEGFEHQPGFTYTLLVARRTIDHPPADGSSLAWRLIKILEMAA